MEKYLEETLNSLVNQTIFDDMEVIMVDDGSKDNSRYIIEKYALDYDNFHAYHKQNEGPSKTRNYGLKLAKGEYIAFLDADDYVSPDAYEKLYNAAQKNNCDVVCENTVRFAQYNIWQSKPFVKAYEDINNHIELTTLKDHLSLLYNTSVCSNIYKRELIENNNIEFVDEDILYEDLLFSLEALLCAESIAVNIDHFVYYWRFRKNKSSITQHTKTYTNVHDRIKISLLSQKSLERYGADSDVANALYSKWLDLDLNMFIRSFHTFSDEQFMNVIQDLKKLLDIIPDDLKEDLNSYQKIMIHMIENDDYDAVKSFSRSFDDFENNLYIPEDLDDKYNKYIDLKKDAKDGQFKLDIVNIDYDDNNILMDFEENFKYHPENTPHEYEAALVDDKNNSYPVKVVENDKKRIIIPFTIFKASDYFTINVKYKYDDLSVECDVRNHKRESIEKDNFYVETGIAYNFSMYFNVIYKVNNEIEISEVTFNDDVFEFKGTCRNKISEVFITNIVELNEIDYKINFKDNNEFSYEIPYSDILMSAVKKWELNFKDNLNCVRLTHNYFFYKGYNKISIRNSRNKIIIYNTLINPAEEYNSLNKKIKKINIERKKLEHKNEKLTDENAKLIANNTKLADSRKDLKEKNKKLKTELDDFKSRKVVVYADKLKNLKN